jgi:vancomycin permeability regulator SanA
LHKYIAEDRNNFREFFARVKSFIDIAIDKKPKFLGPEVNIN